VNSAPRAARLALPDLALAAVAAVAAVCVFRGAMRYGFSQDDFVGLARAAGLAPRLVGPWRFLSQQVYFEAMRALVGLDAWRYHLASLTTHGLAAGLVYAWLARWTSRAGALVGATFFAAHVAAFTALYWVAAFGDLGALVFALAALLVAERRDRARWAALPLFAASLLCKESTLLLPVVAWAAGQARGRGRDPLVFALGAVAVGFALWLARAGSGAAPTGSSLAPYAVGFGHNLPANLLTYAGWVGNAFLPTLHGFSDAVDPGAFAAGAIVLAALVAASFVPAARARGGAVAAVWVLSFLAPVLPLRNHVYHYYAYAALPGVGWLGAIGFDLATARAAGRKAVLARRAWAGALVVALALNGAALVSRVETAPLFGAESRADPTVDRALVASRAIGSVRAANLPPGVRLAFWSPAAALAHGHPDPVERYAARNVRDALEDGLGVRVLCPNVRDCSFVDEAGAARADDAVAVYHPDGAAVVVSRARLDTLLTELPR